MKIVDERETQKTAKKRTKTEKSTEEQKIQ